ncbi:hypothetical protein SDC9_15119 [bioreactor metagenome]|uniref:LarA-like N-terminal domain-containing protein n=1 Tax=bioreactor metagenome TaxID=1076179 RepID=A0A644TRV1_9ZZZZ|nr:hypothetical protein [Negativicutes bacterium]
MADRAMFYRIKQKFERPRLTEIEVTIIAELDKINLAGKIKPGDKVGITVGSRGIANMLVMLKVIVEYIRKAGGEPYLLAGMGSHGGGTPEGQIELLESYNITEQTTGTPILACGESRMIGTTETGLAVYALESAWQVDSILVLNRVKTHTSFKGDLESGLVKELVVGLGGPKGAKQFHSFGSSELARLLREIGTVLIHELPLVGGLAVVENGFEETAVISGVEPKDIIEHDTKLLAYSKTLMPKLPVDQLDLLIVGEMGKNYSGTGVDTNIIGRIRIEGDPEPAKPAIKRVGILDISEASHGNAHGMGLADFTTKKLVDKVDRKKTYLNSITSTFVIRSAIPMYFDTEKELWDGAVQSLGSPEADALRAAIIPNTLFITELWVSKAVMQELKDKSGLEVLEQRELYFDEEGNIGLRIKLAH